jgi:hypothetical protein
MIMNKKNFPIKLKFLLLLFVFIVPSVFAYADVVLNIVVANSSETSTEAVPVRYGLPPQVQKNDILDAGELKINYNETEGVYYLQGKVTLTPQETKKIKIQLRDVWTIPEGQIESLKKMMNDKITSIKDKDEKNIAQLIGDDLRTKLNSILEQQRAAEGNVEEKMKLYSVNTEKLKQLKDKIFSLDSLVRVYQEGGEQKLGTVTLFIEARNVFDQSVQMPIKYYLPPEVIPEYIVDKQGFNLKYDHARGSFYLRKQEKFDPNETKRFAIEIRNIWQIQESVINRYFAEAAELNKRFADTEVAETAEELVRIIKDDLESIVSTQEEATSVKERISAYHSNQKKLAVVKDNIEKLKSLASELPQPEVSQKVMERLESFSNVVLSKMADKLGERIKQVGVWRVVYTILLFLIGIVVFFYGFWFFRLKKQDKRRFEKK